MEWRIRVRGKQRSDLDITLVIRALIMIARSIERDKSRSSTPSVDDQKRRADASWYRGEASAR